MKKIYLTLIFIGVFCLCRPTAVKAQLSDSQNQTEQLQSIEGLRIYPNPVLGNKLYVTSKSGKSKIVTIVNVLGKKVMYEVMTTNELDISRLSPGVYIIQVKQDQKTASRKLVVK